MGKADLSPAAAFSKAIRNSFAVASSNSGPRSAVVLATCVGVACVGAFTFFSPFPSIVPMETRRFQDACRRKVCENIQAYQILVEVRDAPPLRPHCIAGCDSPASFSIEPAGNDLRRRAVAKIIAGHLIPASLGNVKIAPLVPCHFVLPS